MLLIRKPGALRTAHELQVFEQPLSFLAGRQAARYQCRVVIASIREFNRAVPFVPYEIHTASGERFEVPHPDFIVVSPKGSFVIVIDSKERPHHLNSLLIERASPLNGQRRRRRRGSS